MSLCNEEIASRDGDWVTVHGVKALQTLSQHDTNVPAWGKKKKPLNHRLKHKLQNPMWTSCDLPYWSQENQGSKLTICTFGQETIYPIHQPTGMMEHPSQRIFSNRTLKYKLNATL